MIPHSSGRFRLTGPVFGLTVLAYLLLLAAPAAMAQPAAVATGAKLAQANCTRCHVTAPTGYGGWTDAPSFAQIANQPNQSAARISAVVQQQQIHMLNVHRPAKEADAIAAYIMSLRSE